MIVIGVDGGLDGGIARLNSDGNDLDVFVMPTVETKDGKRDLYLDGIAKIFSDAGGDAIAFVERAHAMPKQGVTSSWTNGKNYGSILGLLAGLNIPCTIVSAKKWQNALFSWIEYDDTKEASELVARMLWPGQSWLGTPRSRKAHDGMTDAALIAEYGLCYVLENVKGEKIAKNY